MRALSDNVSERMRTALTGSADTPLVLVGNFEVEDRWAAGEPGLPTVALTGTRAIVNRMDEFCLLLAGEKDYVVLKAPPDDGYLDYLYGLGLTLPRPLTVRAQDPRRIVTDDVLEDAELLAALGALAPMRAHLWPHGVSTQEELLADRSGLPLATPTAAVCKSVNSKIYSRLVADELNLRQAGGVVCRDLDELGPGCAWANARLQSGQPVVLKDAYGVSGKGILVVRDPTRLDQIQKMIERRATRTGDRRVALVIEEWLPKRTDLNYQFTIDRNGTVQFDVVKEALTEAGVHQGHRMPARLNDEQIGQVHDAAQALGHRLAADGYFGVVGVDALVTTDDVLYPMIEINARNNMSTYQERLRQLFFSGGQTVLARQYPVHLNRPVPFAELRSRLDGVLLEPGAGHGLLVNNFATVNAAAPPPDQPAPFDGRLYGIVIAGSPQQAAAIDQETAARLSALASIS